MTLNIVQLSFQELPVSFRDPLIIPKMENDHHLNLLRDPLYYQLQNPISPNNLVNNLLSFHNLLI